MTSNGATNFLYGEHVSEQSVGKKNFIIIINLQE